MRFAFTPEQLAMRDSVRALLKRECPPERVREAWSNADGRVPGLWGKLVELGVPGLLAPEDGLAAFENDDLRGQPEIELWQAVAHAELRSWSAAAR